MAIIIIFIMACIIGIIFLNLQTTTDPQKTRNDYLKEIIRIMEGRSMTIPAYEDSYKILFTFKSEQFEYDDIISKIGNKIIHRGYLRVKTLSNLSLSFNEKTREKFFNKDVVSQIIKPGELSGGRVKLNIPKALREFDIVTNSIFAANAFFQDKKVINILREFKNIDTRGWKHMAIRIKNGEVVLEFNPQTGFKPNLATLRSDPHIIEDNAKKLLVLVARLNTS